ncbi:MAG: hypothetical protein P4M07_05050 [Xanthobacteraceae bacterium]|nr:hypothetical protein [Xanthobacteraceae bacterium]
MTVAPVRSARPVKAMEQGHLDSLCGVYSVVNAVRWVLGGNPPKMSAEDLFATVIGWLEWRAGAAEALTAGVEPKILWRVVVSALDDLRKENGVTIKADRPFARRRRLTAAEVHQTLAREFNASTAGIAYVVVFSGRLNHWSVVRGVTLTSFLLFDSCGHSRVAVDRCRMDGEAGGARDCPHVLEAAGIIRLARQADGSATAKSQP